jgi:23S rRNA-/tRNA-specific pseudouridylate synthase
MAEVRVVHRDGALLVLDKPSGLPTTAPDDGPCLVREAEQLDPRAPGLHASSRLDADVTGMVTFARTRRANRALLEARRQGHYHRVYLALCARSPEPVEGRWQWPIALDPRDPRRRVAVEPGGKGNRLQAASTNYRVLSETPHACLLWLEPHTGRTHQLRVHAARAGSPLLGDRHYGGAGRVVLENGRVLSARRVMLHCARLRLPDVAQGGELELWCPPPADFRELWRSAGGEEVAGVRWE